VSTEPRVVSESLMKLRPRYKFWLETEEGHVFGQGSSELLQRIQEKGTLSGAAEAMGMSYRYAWGMIKQVEKRVGKTVLETYKGGRSGGGGARLTQTGLQLLETYLQFKKAFDQVCVNWEDKIKGLEGN